MDKSIFLQAYAVVWMLLCILSLFFYALAPIPTRKIWHPWILLVLYTLVVVFVGLLYPRVTTMAFTLVIVGLAYYLCVRYVRFCLRCKVTFDLPGLGNTNDCPLCSVIGKRGGSKAGPELNTKSQGCS